MKRVLVACEFSGIVRDAFAGQGWDAWSCDLLPSEMAGNHIQGDVRYADALAFVRLLLDSPVARIALENPIGCISSQIRKPDQIIQPWQFGHDASKATCLWLKGLPKLKATGVILPRIVHGKKRWGNQTDSGQNKLGPSADRWAKRSITYPGIAQAMAEQWGNIQ